MTKRPQLWMVRHGATEWSEAGKHTSTTDLPLLESGRRVAQKLAQPLSEHDFAAVLSSPRRRARETAKAAGFPDPGIDQDLVEWAYGPGEGLTTPEIRETIPDWLVWTHGAPDLPREGYSAGETCQQVSQRLDRVVERVRETDGDTLVFGHGHALRALAVRWLGLPVSQGQHFPLQTGTLSILGWEREIPGMVRWNAGG